MSLFHNSPFMEKAASHFHLTWAVISVMQGLFSACAGLAVYPLAGFGGVISFYFSGMVYCCWADREQREFPILQSHRRKHYSKCGHAELASHALSYWIVN